MSISTFPAKPITLAIAMGIFLAGCGGRESRPVPATNVADTSLDCPAIAREFEANERQIVVTLQEKDSAVAKNVVLGVTGRFFSFRRFSSWIRNRRRKSRSTRCATAIAYLRISPAPGVVRCRRRRSPRFIAGSMTCRRRRLSEPMLSGTDSRRISSVWT